MLTNIAVFCGSREGYDEQYMNCAWELGREMAAQKIGLVYGGARVGLMGAIADGVLNNSGKAIGVIPEFLCTKEVAHDGLTELVVVQTMHERKLKMHELSDGIITLPGGWGTMEEMFEMLTWAQLGLHRKPIGLLNINGFYDGLNVLVNNMVQEGFLQEEVSRMLLVSDSIIELLVLLQNYRPPAVPQLITPQTT